MEEKRPFKQKVQEWARKYADSTHAKGALFINAFIESSFFPIPPDILLASVITSGVKKWWVYAAITTLGSLLGGIVAYGIGLYVFEIFGEGLISYYNLEDELVLVKKWYDDNAFGTIFVSAFTFIPYKLFTISAGLFKINLFIFIVASFLGRGARFFLLGYLFNRYNTYLEDKIYRYFNIASVFVIVVLLFFLLK